VKLDWLGADDTPGDTAGVVTVGAEAEYVGAVESVAVGIVAGAVGVIGTFWAVSIEVG
jgi:ammonia channel protein AmtB